MASRYTFKRKFGYIAILVTLATVVISCSDANEPVSSIEEIGRMATATKQVLPAEDEYDQVFTPTSTSTSAPPSPIPATNTPLPTSPPSLPAATRINFTPGTTCGTATGTIAAGETKNFVLKAMMGQPLLASVVSHNNDVIMSIVTEDGVELLSAEKNRPSWQGTLPATQDYYFQLSGAQEEEKYSLWISIPKRIEFEPGTTSATESGVTIDGYNVSYVVAGSGGQILDVLLTPDNGMVALTIWGFSDGQPYVRSVAGSTGFRKQLPSTQDYIINVVPYAANEVEFTLRVEIK